MAGMTLMGTKKRAQDAELPLRVFAGETGMLTSGDWENDRSAVVSEMMACVMHYCAAHRMDPAVIAERAARTFKDEQEVERLERRFRFQKTKQGGE